MDDVDLALRRHRFYATDLLEAEILPHQPPVLERLHGARGVFDISDHVVLQLENRNRGADPDAGDLCRADDFCVSDQVRLYFVDAVSVWESVGADPVRVHGCFLPV